MDTGGPYSADSSFAHPLNLLFHQSPEIASMFQPIGPHMSGYYASNGVAMGNSGAQAVLSLPPAPPPPPTQSPPQSSHSLGQHHSAGRTSSHSHQRTKIKSHARSNRDKSEISCCLKYLIFGSNVVFWLLGLVIMMIGFWAWTEKDIFNNFSRITSLALDPAFILIVGGCVAFTIGFTGCVGALRENTCLLAGVSNDRHHSSSGHHSRAYLLAAC